MEEIRWRIDQAAFDLSDIAEADHLSAGVDGNFKNIRFVLERAGNAKCQILVAAIDRAGRTDVVLRGDGGKDGSVVEAHGRHALGQKFDNDFLVLRADELGLLDQIDIANERRAHLVDIIAEFALGKAVRRETIDDAEHVAEIVVEEGPDNALGQRMANIADLLPDFVPRVGHELRRVRTLEVDIDRHNTRPRDRTHAIETGDFL